MILLEFLFRELPNKISQRGQNPLWEGQTRRSHCPWLEYETLKIHKRFLIQMQIGLDKALPPANPEAKPARMHPLNYPAGSKAC
jgi:hypothetical protein